MTMKIWKELKWTFRNEKFWIEIKTQRRLEPLEEKNSELEDKLDGITQNTAQKDKEMKKTKDRLSNMEDSIKRPNIHLAGIIKRELKEKTYLTY